MIVGFMNIILEPLGFSRSRWTYTAIYQSFDENIEIVMNEGTSLLTMIFTVPPHSEAPCFDGRETQTNSLAQGGRVDVRNTVLVTDSTVGKV